MLYLNIVSPLALQLFSFRSMLIITIITIIIIIIIITSERKVYRDSPIVRQLGDNPNQR